MLELLKKLASSVEDSSKVSETNACLRSCLNVRINCLGSRKCPDEIGSRVNAFVLEFLSNEALHVFTGGRGRLAESSAAGGVEDMGNGVPSQL